MQFDFNLSLTSMIIHQWAPNCTFVYWAGISKGGFYLEIGAHIFWGELVSYWYSVTGNGEFRFSTLSKRFSTLWLWLHCWRVVNMVGNGRITLGVASFCFCYALVLLSDVRTMKCWVFLFNWLFHACRYVYCEKCFEEIQTEMVELSDEITGNPISLPKSQFMKTKVCNGVDTSANKFLQARRNLPVSVMVYLSIVWQL